MKKMINAEHIEGRIYQHNLTIKTVQNQQSENYGKSFISGDLEIAVDEDGMNVIQVHYTYVTETTKSGTKNSTFAALEKIINEGKVWITDGKDAAMKVKIDTALALNDFYTQSDELISTKRNEGGFLTIVKEICDEGINRHKFTTDMLITSVKRVEPEDKPEDTHVVLKGAIFNFRNDILPVEFIVRNPDGINYFENLGISQKQPLFTKVWGKINSVTKKERHEDTSAFGESAISYSEKKVKEWTITGVSPEAYEYGDENILTENEITEAMQNREIMLAEKKRQRDEWQSSSGNATPLTNGSMNQPISTGGFQF